MNTKTIEQAIKEYSVLLCRLCSSSVIPTDEYNKTWPVNVLFLTADKTEDETQFDIKPHQFDYLNGKCPELEKLWKNFCEENHIKQSAVIAINIATAPI